MEGYSAHWESTLMGLDFWRRQDEKDENPMNKSFIQDDQSINRRHFTSLSGKSSNKPSLSTIRRRRRFSMSEFMGREAFINPGQSTDSSIASSHHSSTRLFDFGKSSSSRSRSFSNKPSDPPREVSILRNAFNVNSTRRRGRRRESIDSILSIPPPKGLGTPDKPFMHFRGGASWKYLEADTDSLGLDLFWPIKDGHQGGFHDDSSEMLGIQDLLPLCTFRNLRVLKITGMVQSYQKYIWQTAWLNANLDELELGMALGPCVRKSFVSNWPFIKGGWRMSGIQYGEPVYHGNGGTGNLNRKVGIGEYLDKLSIEQAKLRAMMQSPISPRLSIRRLTLTGFVVDADPFLLWFDPGRLQRIYFKNDCVDAGFYLPSSMQGKVTVSYPRRAQEYAIAMPIRRVDLKEDLKVVEFRAGKKVSEKPYHEKPKRDKNPRWNKGRKWKKRKDEDYPLRNAKTTEKVGKDGREFQHAQGLYESSNPKHKGSRDGGTSSSCAVSESSYLPDTNTTTVSNSRDASSVRDADESENVGAIKKVHYIDFSNGKLSDGFDEKPDASKDLTTAKKDVRSQKKETNHSGGLDAAANTKTYNDDGHRLDEHKSNGTAPNSTTTSVDDHSLNLTRSITFDTEMTTAMPSISRHNNCRHRRRRGTLSWIEKPTK